MAKNRRIYSGKKRISRKNKTGKRMHGGYNSAWSYVSSVFGDLNTQTNNSLLLQPGQDVVASQSTQSVPIGNPNANVKGMIKFEGGKRRRRRHRSSRRKSIRHTGGESEPEREGSPRHNINMEQEGSPRHNINMEQEGSPPRTNREREGLQPRRTRRTRRRRNREM